MEIRGVKVPETINELNALGEVIKIYLEDFTSMCERMKEDYGEDKVIDFVAMQSDYEDDRLAAAYNLGIELLIGNAISEVTQKLVRSNATDRAVKRAIEKAYEKEGGNTEELILSGLPF